MAERFFIYKISIGTMESSPDCTINAPCNSVIVTSLAPKISDGREKSVSIDVPASINKSICYLPTLRHTYVKGKTTYIDLRILHMAAIVTAVNTIPIIDVPPPVVLDVTVTITASTNTVSSTVADIKITKDAYITAVTGTSSLNAYIPAINAVKNVNVNSPPCIITVYTTVPTIKLESSSTIQIPMLTVIINTLSPAITATKNVSNTVTVATNTVNSTIPVISAIRNITVNIPQSQLTVNSTSPSINNDTVNSVPIKTVILNSLVPTIISIKNVSNNVGVKTVIVNQTSPSIVTNGNNGLITNFDGGAFPTGTTFGLYDFIIVNDSTRGKVAQSNNVGGHLTRATMRIPISVNNIHDIYFDAWYSCERGYDFFEVHLDNDIILSVSGTDLQGTFIQTDYTESSPSIYSETWIRYTIKNVPAGKHDLVFSYVKDDLGNKGYDMVKIDEVGYIPSPNTSILAINYTSTAEKTTPIITAIRNISNTVNVNTSNIIPTNHTVSINKNASNAVTVYTAVVNSTYPSVSTIRNISNSVTVNTNTLSGLPPIINSIKNISNTVAVSTNVINPTFPSVMSNANNTLITNWENGSFPSGTTFGTYNFVIANDPINGKVAKSNNVGMHLSSALMSIPIRLTNNADIYFDAWFSSEYSYDYFAVQLDYTTKLSVSGTSSTGAMIQLNQTATQNSDIKPETWVRYTLTNVPAGNHYLDFRFNKDEAGSGGLDEVRIDTIGFVPYPDATISIINFSSRVDKTTPIIIADRNISIPVTINTAVLNKTNPSVSATISVSIQAPCSTSTVSKTFPAITGNISINASVPVSNNTVSKTTPTLKINSIFNVPCKTISLAGYGPMLLSHTFVYPSVITNMITSNYPTINSSANVSHSVAALNSNRTYPLIETEIYLIIDALSFETNNASYHIDSMTNISITENITAIKIIESMIEVIMMALQGDTIKIQAEFRDYAGKLVDPDSINLKIYENYNQLIQDIEVSPTQNKVSNGVYEILYTVPFGAGSLIYEVAGNVKGKISVTRGKLSREWVR